MHRPFLPIAVCAVMVGALAALGCTPSIGDKCSSSTDCSLRGDRLCDTTQPGGYCTVFNCEPNNCPEEAQCVAFNSQLDPVCTETQDTPRFQRTFCMFRCESDGDCRGGYTCLDTTQQPNAWGAIIVDTDSSGPKICVAASPAQIPQSGNDDLCHPYDGGFPDVGYYEPDVTENIDVGAPDVADVSVEQDVSVQDAPDAQDVSAEPEASVDAAEAGVDAAEASADAAEASADADEAGVDAGADGADASD